MDNPFEVVTQVGHDLNKYLARIKAYNQLLLIRLEKVASEEEKSFFEGIEQECDSMFRFIRDLVTADKVSAPGTEGDFEVIAMDNFIRSLAQRHQAAARMKHIELMMDQPLPALSAKVHVNSFERALNNLLHNALKFTPENGKILVGAHLSSCQQFAVITIADTGIGIPASLRPYVFDRFTRAGRTGIHGEESNGLGMYITKNIIEKHGGNIWFDTEENKGTTFTIQLPVMRAPS